MCRSRDVSRSSVSDSGLACAECGLRHTVLREAWEEPFERPPPNLVDFCSPLFLKDCVAVYSQDVVDAINSQTLPLEGKFCLRVLTQLNSFVHCSAMYCRGPAATPSVMLPTVTVEILATFCTSRIFHSRGAASRSFTL